MALTTGLQQGVIDAGPQANHRRGLDAQPGGDRIGGAKANAADIAGQAVGVLGHHLHGFVAVGLEDSHRPRRADAMAVQKHHDLAHHLLIRPGGGDAAGPHPANPRHLTQALGRLLDHLQYLRPEGGHQLAGIDRADAADHARAQVFLDPLGRGGRRGAQEGGLELLAVLAAIHPGATDRDPFAGTDLGGMAHHSHQFAVAAGLDAQHAEAVVGVMEGDPLDRAGQHFGGLGGGGVGVVGRWALAGSLGHRGLGGSGDQSAPVRRSNPPTPATAPPALPVRALAARRRRAAPGAGGNGPAGRSS